MRKNFLTDKDKKVLREIFSDEEIGKMTCEHARVWIMLLKNKTLAEDFLKSLGLEYAKPQKPGDSPRINLDQIKLFGRSQKLTEKNEI